MEAVCNSKQDMPAGLYDGERSKVWGRPEADFGRHALPTPSFRSLSARTV
jgi:hypothetical protein